MKIRDKLGKERLYFDGGMGSLLIDRGLKGGELPETWNINRPDEIQEIHEAYILAGADIITANTFGANPLKFENAEEIITAGIKLVRNAIDKCGRGGFAAYDVGPLGKLLKPIGELDFEDAVSLFAAGVKAGAAAGADLIIIETMSDCLETKAAVLAAKENSDLPVFVTNAYDASHKLMTGASPAAMVAMLEGLHANAIGVNCSLGPEQMLPVVEELIRYASVPVIVQPNAGIPRTVGGKTIYDVDAEAFSDVMVKIAEMGTSILGGCCGTTPEFIRLTSEKTRRIPYLPPEHKHDTIVSSYSRALEIGNFPVLIGERINPTGKKRFKQALCESDVDYILGVGIAQEEQGAHILDVNVGLPEIDEADMLSRVTASLQAVTDLPLQIDTVDTVAMERALRLYNGKAMINSVNGKEESLKSVLPIAAKYGGVIVALTLDERGIPDTAEERLRIAENIVARAAEYGIPKKDIVADPLAMTISANPDSANTTLRAVRHIKERLGIKVSLGVSNISFGLPQRELINSAFFLMALENGLDCAILNPASAEMMKSYYTYLALTGRDEACGRYIEFAEGYKCISDAAANGAVPVSGRGKTESGLRYCIEKGLTEAAIQAAGQLLEHDSPTDVIDREIIPALDEVGRGFERKTVYLPQLLMSAEAAKAAFEVVRSKLTRDSDKRGDKVVLATVKGDIHDIGKNIVKVLLENYGFEVIDLGRDVPPERVYEAVVQSGARLVGLSALMTTTVPSMEDTVRLIHEKCPGIKTVVGGAVLTQEYADMIGADFYSKDAMQTVRCAEKIYSEFHTADL